MPDLTPVVVALLMCAASCAPRDPVPPWDAAEIVRDVSPDLALLEKAPVEFSEIHILARRVDTHPDRPQERRFETALLWGRIGPAGAPIACGFKGGVG